MPDLKIIIPMAGIGQRMGPLTRYRPKALVRLTDKRLLDHVLDTFKELEKTYTLEYVFIIGYLGEQIREHMKSAHPDKRVTYFTQEQLMGQSHAVYLARDAISGPILLTYCDTINRIDFSFLSFDDVDGVASVQEVEDPRRHGVAVTGPDQLITRLIEKPGTMEHKAALTGVYYFAEGKELIKGIQAQMQRGTSLNNEYYLADAINILLDGGIRIKAENAVQWLDAGTPAAMINANAHLLAHDGHKESPVDRLNILIPPVYIHENSRVEYSVIGPNVSIGTNCSINGSIIQNSIIDDASKVSDAMLTDSLMGEGCSISGASMQAILADREGMIVACAANRMNGTDDPRDS